MTITPHLHNLFIEGHEREHIESLGRLDQEEKDCCPFCASVRKPPIHCTPCRVTYNGFRYQIESDGSVRFVPQVLAFPKGFEATISSYQTVRGFDPEPESIAKLVRREASRLRRNRNARKRNQAMRDLGMTKTPYGWE